MLLAAQCHLGTKNVTTRMTPYVYKRRPDGKHEKDYSDESGIDFY